MAPLRRSLPLIVLCLALFLFFLPMRTLEISGAIAGFSINPARFFILLATLLLAMNLAMDPRYLFRHVGGKVAQNPYIVAFVIYALLSTLYYYARVLVGESFLFSNDESFFRSWRGRPIAQFIALMTYGVVPYYLMFRFSLIDHSRRFLERAFIGSALLLTLYGFVQQASFYLWGHALTPQNFSTGLVPLAFSGDYPLLRFYSFAGEPRDFGSFILGALFLYASVRVHSSRPRTWLMVALFFVAFILTLSSSAFVIAAISLFVIFVDVVYRTRFRPRVRHLRVAIILCVLLLVVIGVQRDLVTAIVSRPLGHYTKLVEGIGKRQEITSELSTQAMDLATLYYIAQLPSQHPLLTFFGYGYGNFLTPIAPLMLYYFDFDVIHNLDQFRDTRSFLAKIFVEGGVVGVALYFLIFFSALRTHRRTLRLLRARGDRTAYLQALLLRLSFIVFFVSGSFQISYYSFIVLGMLMAQVSRVDAAAARETLESEHVSLSKSGLR